MRQEPNHKILAGFFIIALSTLVFELLLSRVMSVVAWYHFAFMAICLALFGMTVGAVIVHRYREILLKEYCRFLYLCAIAFASTVFINLTIISRYPAFTNISAGDWQIVYHPMNIFLIFTSIAAPLIVAGVVISLVFSAHAHQANKIYFIDLAGASLGCLLFIPIINFLGVINSYFLIILLGLFAAYLFTLNEKRPRTIFILMLFTVFGISFWTTQKAGLLELRWAKGQPDNLAFYKKWNSFSYIRLIDWGKEDNPEGWGFAPKRLDEIQRTLVDQIYLDIDAIAGTFMLNFENRDLEKINFLKYDITAMAHYLLKDADVLVIGIGAGRDILTGLLFHQKSITGVEINETILDIHQRLLRKYSGDLSRHPNVTFVHNEARSFINSSKKKFDLIQLSLIDTFAATQAGAYALTENNLYTIEAFQAYVRHLTDHGFLTVSYWMHPGSPEAMLKLTGAAALALRREGILNPRAHMVMVRKDGLQSGRGVANLLIKRTPFSDEELSRIQQYCDEMGFEFTLSPIGAKGEGFAKMSDPSQMTDYARNYKLNIAPASDDKPFFFLLTRLNFAQFLREFKLFNASAENILFSLLLLMLFLTCVFVLWPLIKTTPGQWSAATIPFAVYFTAIGLGFMFIEMSQLTRLSSFLGHPIYSLSIVLFSFLFSSGVGSYFLGHIDEKKALARCCAVFLSIGILAALFSSHILDYFSKYPIYQRMIVAVGAVFPLGFFMGAFLPQGIRRLEEQRGPVALFWGLNGATSVLGSILAMIFQITWGINITFAAGVALYVLAVFVLFKLKN